MKMLLCKWPVPIDPEVWLVRAPSAVKTGESLLPRAREDKISQNFVILEYSLIINWGGGRRGGEDTKKKTGSHFCKSEQPPFYRNTQTLTNILLERWG